MVTAIKLGQLVEKPSRGQGRFMCGLLQTFSDSSLHKYPGNCDMTS